jgi:hypothetical protein
MSTPESPISKQEMQKLEDDSSGWNVPHAIGYISRIRAGDLTLTEVHRASIEKLTPGVDYEANKSMLVRVFNYLSEHASEFKIKVE